MILQKTNTKTGLSNEGDLLAFLTGKFNSSLGFRVHLIQRFNDVVKDMFLPVDPVSFL